MENSGFLDKWEPIIPKIAESWVKEQRRRYNLTDEKWNNIKKKIDINLIRNAYANVIAQGMTIEEMNKINDFYKTPEAKKLLKIQNTEEVKFKGSMEFSMQMIMTGEMKDDEIK